jgi:hypothetical protein
MDGVNFNKLNNVTVKGQYQVKITNRFAAEENLNDDDMDINRSWESTRKNMKALATESLGYC